MSNQIPGEISEPSFKIGDKVSEEKRELLTKLEAGIKESPDLYAAAFDSYLLAQSGMGIEALSKQARYLKENPAQTDQFADIFDEWKDKWLLLIDDETAENLSFDIITENSAADYEPIAKLKAEGRDSRTRDERKQEIKNELRIERIRFFMSRVALFNEAEVIPVPSGEAGVA